MKTTTAHRQPRRDAPFWAKMLIGAISLGTLGCFYLAAAQRAPEDVAILTTDDCPPPADL